MAEISTDIDAQALEGRLKSSLWFTIGKIVDEETIKLGINATPQFIGSLTELVWAQIESVAVDLEAFASHGGRSTIKVEDVMLLTRRNEGLESILKDFVDRLRERNEKEQKRAKGGGHRGKSKKRKE